MRTQSSLTGVIENHDYFNRIYLQNTPPDPNEPPPGTDPGDPPDDPDQNPPDNPPGRGY